jgi:hypothetical protein
MAAHQDDAFVKAGNPGSATSLAAPGYSTGGTSINVVSTTNWPTDTGVVFAIDEIGVDGLRIDGTYNVYQGTVATGTSITNVSHISGTGTDRNYSAGATTRVYIVVASEIQNRLVAGILTHADQDGTLKAGAVDVAAVVASGVLTADRSTAGANIETWRSEDVFDHIASGCVWSGDAYGSTRVASCTSGVVYLAGKRLTVAAVTARTFTASRDVYCDLSDNGDGTAIWNYTDNTTNAASPALTAGRLRGAIIVVGASNIANVGSVNMGEETKVLPIASSIAYSVTDSLGNLICPRDPSRRTLGVSIRTSDFTTTSTSATDVTGVSTTVIVPTGRKIKLSASLRSADITTAGANAQLRISEGSTDYASHLFIMNSDQKPLAPSTILTPTAGVHTYKLRASTSAGTLSLYSAGGQGIQLVVELA